MSTKTRKTTAAASAREHEASTSSSTPKRGTPLSPARATRLEEKQQLQHLNDRLAKYIDRNRDLENENSRLTTLISKSEECKEHEITSVKEIYERELKSLRDITDETGRERAQAGIQVNSLKEKVSTLDKKLKKKENELNAAQKEIGRLEKDNLHLQNENNKLISENKKYEEDFKDADQERQSLAAALESANEKLSDHAVKVVDLQNRLQSLKEELTFKDAVHEKELSESRHIKSFEVSSIEQSIREDSDQRLLDSLQELRGQYETQMKLSSEEMVSIYEKKLFELQKSCEEKVKAAKIKEDEMRTAKSNVSMLTSKVAELESQVESLRSRARDLDSILQQERDWHAIALQAKEEELAALREESQQQLNEYQDLLSIKVALDLEIATYRKLLEGEEARLHITPEGIQTRKATPLRSTLKSMKRKWGHSEESERMTSNTEVTGSAQGDVTIEDHDLEGKYIKIFNKGEADISLGGWQLVRRAGDQENIYKFPRNTLLKPNAYITVWSSNANQAHNPPTDYVMKNQRFFVADTMSSVVINNNGEEVAERKTVKRYLMRERSSESSYPPEEIYHQQGDFTENQGCSIM